uniref:Uncharacterized protein n=1 Tax=Arundo donax TaxID=35708 RepID=A0A0A9H054_ARUDO
MNTGHTRWIFKFPYYSSIVAFNL